MLVQRRPIKTTLIYVLLVTGAVVFSFPFIWMICSSIKVNREMFPEKLEILPRTPTVRAVSPYVDTDYFRYALSERNQPYLSVFRELIEQVDYTYPSTVSKEEAVATVTLGFADKMDSLLPDVIWSATPASYLTLLDRFPDVPQEDAGAHALQLPTGKLYLDLARELRAKLPPASWRLPVAEFREQVVRTLAREWATPAVVDNLFQKCYRWLGIGQLRIRSYDLQRQVLGEGQPTSRRLDIITPNALWLQDTTVHNNPCAVAHSDFTVQSKWRMEGSFEAAFDLADFHRLELYMKPDDNWHQLWCFVEMQGKLYRAVRPVHPADFEWTTFQWQLPGPDDQSNKIKTWTLLKQIDEGEQYASGRTINVAFELRQNTQLGAWWGKIKRNYILTMKHIPVWRYTATSFYLVILNIVLAMISCSMVAYAVARLQWPGRDFCFVLMLATMMIPPQVTMIPGFLIWKNLGLYNTLVPLWLPAMFGIPFFIFLLRQFLKSIPRDLEDAARIDGCTYWQIYWHIMLPLVKPTLAVIAIGTFLATWNNFMGPLIFIADQRLYPLAFGLYAFAVQVGNDPALTMAGSFLMTAPIIVVFFFAQRYFIEGVTLTGMKG